MILGTALEDALPRQQCVSNTFKMPDSFSCAQYMQMIPTGIEFQRLTAVLRRYLTLLVFQSALSVFTPEEAMAKPKKPEPPKEQYITIERREPNAGELQLLLEAALKLGVRPGYAGVMANHESAGTWHPQVRPNHPDKPPVKITTTGEVRGTPGSTGVGIGQWLETRWMLDMYKHGESIIATAGLEKVNPEAVRLIRSINKSVQAELDRTKQKANWNSIDVIEGKLDSTPDGIAFAKLRSDPTNRIPIYMLMHNLRDYQQELESFGLPVNGQNLYGTHHTSAAEVANLVRKKDYIPGDDPKWAKAAERNGLVFMHADGTMKTGAETHNKYGQIVNEALATRFEQEYYGRDFGTSPDASKQRVLKANDGQAYKVRNDLIIPRLPAEQFLAAWKQPSVTAEKPEHLSATVAGLERLGFDFGKAKPTDFNNSRLRAAITSFKHQAGLPYADKGELDTNTQRYLQQSVSNADKYIALQQGQKASLQQRNGLDLRNIAKQLRDVPKDNPVHAQVANVVIDIKQKLAKEGLLKEPSTLQRVKGADGKTRRVEVKKPFDGLVDGRTISALSAYQRNNGLMDTKGVFDSITATRLSQGAAPAAVAPAPVRTPAPAAAPPALPKAPSRSASGIVTGKAEPVSPTQQFTAMSTSLSTVVNRKVGVTAGSTHIGPYVPSYGYSLSKGNKEFDERVYEAQRLIERTGHGHLLGKLGSDGLYGDDTDKAFAAYAASKHISKKPGEVNDVLLAAMREDRLALATKGRTPDFFEQYLTQFGAPANVSGSPDERARLFNNAYPNVISSQLHDPSNRWGKTAFGITPNEADFKAATQVLVDRGHLKPEELQGPNATERAKLALREYQADIGLIPTGRLDRATVVSIAQTYQQAEMLAGRAPATLESSANKGASGQFNLLGTTTAGVSTSVLASSLGMDVPEKTPVLRRILAAAPEAKHRPEV